MDRCITLTQTDNDVPGRGLTFELTGDGVPIIKTLPEDIQPEDDEADLRWYLEEHARRDPFERNRAKKTALYLQRLAARLTEHVLDEIPLEWSLRIFVRSNGKPNSRFHSIHWELLELQKASRRRIIVVRIVKKGTQVPNIISPNASGFNISLVVARLVAVDAEDSAETEHRLVSQPLVDALENSPVNVHIIRPGTFGALRDHLKSAKERGQPVNLVHMDVHGVVKRHQGEIRASLKFMNSDLKYELVEAAEVVKLFSLYGVKIVILNACESAHSNANMAEILVQHGVQFVFAMSYRIMTSSVATMMARFYTSFLQEKKDSWTAASDARQVLREAKSRQARFGLDVGVDDWIVPVAYGVKDQELRINWTTGRAPGPRSSLSARFSSFGKKNTALPPQISVPIGREALIYQIESNLLLKASSLILHGESGWGKTHLARYLCQWWNRTGFTTKQFLLEIGDFVEKHPIYICRDLIARLNGSHQGTIEEQSSKTGSLSRQLAKLKVRRNPPASSETYEELITRIKNILLSLGDLQQKETWPLIILDGLNVPEDSANHAEWKELLSTFKGAPCFVLTFCGEPFMAQEFAKLISLPRLSVHSCHQLQRKIASASEQGTTFDVPRGTDDENSVAPEKLFKRLDFLPGSIEIMALQSRTTTSSDIEKKFTTGQDILQDPTSISHLNGSTLYNACEKVFHDSNAFEKSIFLGLSLFETFPRDLDGFAKRLLKYECLEVPVPSRDWTPSAVRKAILERGLDIFAAASMFGGWTQKTVSSFTHELRGAGLIYLSGAYLENETLIICWKLHPVFTFYLRRKLGELKVEERTRYHEAFVDYHEWRTTSPPPPTADNFDPLPSSVGPARRELSSTLQPSNIIDLPEEIDAGKSNFLSALDIALEWTTRGGKSPSISSRFPLQILHAIHLFDGSLVISAYTNSVDSIAEYTSRTIAAFVVRKSDGHIFCPKEKVDFAVLDPTRASQALVVKSLMHYSEWLCRFYLMRDASKLNNQIRITRDLVSEIERNFLGLQDISESIEELKKFEKFADDPVGNANLVNTLFQGAPSGPEILPLKVARLFQELGAQGTEFQMKLQSFTCTTQKEIEDALKHMDSNILRIAREIAPLWDDYLSFARGVPELAASLRVMGIRLVGEDESGDDSDDNSMAEIFGAEGETLASTLGQSTEMFVDVIEKINEGESDSEILAWLSVQNVKLLEKFQDKKLVLDGLEIQTGRPQGVELSHSLLIQQYTSRRDWSGLLEHLDSVWIQERNTPQEQLSMEKLLLVGRWHLLRGISHLNLFHLQESYDELIKAFNISSKDNSIAMSQIQFRSLLYLAGLKKDAKIGEIPAWDIMFRLGILVYYPDHNGFFTRDGKIFTDIYEILHERLMSSIRGLMGMENMMTILGIQPTDAVILRLHDRLEALVKNPALEAQSSYFFGMKSMLESAMEPILISLATRLDPETRALARTDLAAAIEHLSIEHDTACWLIGRMMEATQPLTISWYENVLQSARLVVRAKNGPDIAFIEKGKQLLQDAEERFIPEIEWAKEHGEKSPKIQELLTEVEHMIFLKNKAV